MYKKVLCLIMGRGGSHAVSRWVQSQYPEELQVVFSSDFLAGSLPLVLEFMTDYGPEYRVFRQECLDIRHAADLLNMSPPNQDRIVVYSARDPWDHAAALAKFWARPGGARSHESFSEKMASIQCVYFKNLKTVLRNALGLEQILPTGSIFIDFNRLFSSAEYRAQIANQLGLPTSEKGVNTVWNRSAFHGHPKTASELNLTSRWQAYVNRESFRRLFQDDELIELASQFWQPPFRVGKDRRATIL